MVLHRSLSEHTNPYAPMLLHRLLAPCISEAGDTREISLFSIKHSFLFHPPNMPGSSDDHNEHCAKREPK